MQTKRKNSFLQAMIVGGIATVLVYFLNTMIFAPVGHMVTYGSYFMAMCVNLIFDMILGFGGVVLAALVYCKLIAKRPMPVGISMASGAIGCGGSIIVNKIVYALGAGMLNTLVTLILNFSLFTVASLLIVKKVSAGQTEQVVNFAVNAQPASVAQPVQIYPEGNVVPVRAEVAGLEGLSECLLKAIKPTLRAPMTAVLCSEEEMTIMENNGVYTISGYVNSQNGYGAMIMTDFTATARRAGDTWAVGNVRVGVKTAKNNAKSFFANYIAISIFVGVMGLLGYLLLTLAIG